MSTILARRGFLRGLTTLPLVGGSVALVGHPTAVAAPPSRRLAGAYAEFLRLEHAALAQDLGWTDGQGVPLLHAAGGTLPLLPGAGAAHLFHRDALRIGPEAAPMTRAALVLAAVGLNPDLIYRSPGDA